MQKRITNALRLAHLASAVTLGILISISEAAPLRLLWGGFAVLIALVVSYRALYVVKKPRTYSDTPIDDEVRRDLGIKD
jgi:hypothetical protein